MDKRMVLFFVATMGMSAVVGFLSAITPEDGKAQIGKLESKSYKCGTWFPLMANLGFFKNDGGSHSEAEKAYKIHIMPKLDQLVEVADLIATAMCNDTDLYNSVSELFKITDPRIITDAQGSKFLFDAAGHLLPFIVIYTESPEKGQLIIEKLDKLFNDKYTGIQLKDFPSDVQKSVRDYGVNKRGEEFVADSYISPRFNIVASTRDGKRTSSLIYYAQGNADSKCFKQYDTFSVKPDSSEYKKFLEYKGLPQFKLLENGDLDVPYYASKFDPNTKGALLYGAEHLYLPDKK